MQLQTKELHVLITVHRDAMPNATCIDPGQPFPKYLRGISALRRVGPLLNRRPGIPKNSGPLRNRIVVIRRRDGGIGASVINLHAGPDAVVSRVSIVDIFGPLFRGEVHATARAVAVPAGDGVSEEATARNARVVDNGREEVRISGCEDALSPRI